MKRGFLPRMQMVLPLVYDDSLSYMEQVAKLTKVVNEIIQELESLPDLVEEALAPFKAEFLGELNTLRENLTVQVTQLREYVEEENARITDEVEQFKRDTQIRQENFEGETNLRIAQIKVELENSYRNFIDIVEVQLKDISDYINGQLNLMRVELEAKFLLEHEWTVEEIAKIQKQVDEMQFKLPKMYNPVKGINDNIVDTIHDVYNADRYFGTTANAWDYSCHTAEEFDNRGIKALRFDTHSAIDYTNSTLWHMRNPLTGKNILIADMLYKVIDILMDAGHTALTALEYDTLEVTANEFDTKDELTAYEFDFMSSLLFN